MTKYVCRQCGSDRIGVLEQTPRFQSIVITDDELDWDIEPDGEDETFYEESVIEQYECIECGLVAKDLSDLVTAGRANAEPQ